MMALQVQEQRHGLGHKKASANKEMTLQRTRGSIRTATEHVDMKEPEAEVRLLGTKPGTLRDSADSRPVLDQETDPGAEEVNSRIFVGIINTPYVYEGQLRETGGTGDHVTDRRSCD